jgi:hypothetical protein
MMLLPSELLFAGILNVSGPRCTPRCPEAHFRSRSTIVAGGQEGQAYPSWPAGALVPREMPPADLVAGPGCHAAGKLCSYRGDTARPEALRQHQCCRASPKECLLATGYAPDQRCNHPTEDHE